MASCGKQQRNETQVKSLKHRIQESNTEVLESLNIFFGFHFFYFKNRNPQAGLFLKTITPWPASAMTVRAPFLDLSSFQKIPRGCVTLNAFKAQIRSQKTNSSGPGNASKSLRFSFTFKNSSIFALVMRFHGHESSEILFHCRLLLLG